MRCVQGNLSILINSEFGLMQILVIQLKVFDIHKLIMSDPYLGFPLMFSRNCSHGLNFVLEKVKARVQH